MAYFSKDFIRKVTDSVDIVDVISTYVPLKRAGTRYKARCPFHTEKTPSFTVTPEMGRYYCFGCHANGDVINFIMEINNLNFQEAVEYLANMQGIPIEYEKGEQRYSVPPARRTSIEDKKQMYNILTDAGRYFHNNLLGNDKAMKYLLDRGLSKETIKKFGLGFALDDYNALFDYLTKKGYERKLIAEVGLLREKDNDVHYDYFRDRIMFPIQEVSGKIIAFGGRIFETAKKEVPKYLNSPETPVFKKNSTLYNLNNARNYLDKKPLILVEGYMDVIALWDKGVKNCAASLGTAFNENHAKLINRYTRDVIIMYDADTAGEKATLSASKILEDTEIYPKVVRLPEGEDPDSFILKNGFKEFNKKIKEGCDSITYKVRQAAKKYDMNDSWEKVNYIKEACSIIGSVKDEVRRADYIKRLSMKSGVEVDTIEKELMTHNYINANFIKDSNVKKKSVTEKKNTIIRAQNTLFKYILENLSENKKLLALDLKEEMVIGENYKEIYKYIFTRLHAGKSVDINDLMIYNKELSIIISGLISREIEIKSQDVEYSLLTLRKYEISKRLKGVQSKINSLGENEGEKLVEVLFKEFDRLKKELAKTEDLVKQINTDK